MHKRMLLVIAPLCVVALAAGVAFAAPMAADPDNPHAMRPTAASSEDPTAYTVRSLGDLVGYLQAVAFVNGIEAAQFKAFLDAAAAEQAAQAEQARPAVTSYAAPASQDNGGFLDCVKQRESRGDYTVHNTQGSGASGAYQFLPSTWDSIASSSGRSDLVGVDPAAASPADQDAMAAQLYSQQGTAPWGGGC
jgi:hypothetical protein